LPTGAGVNNEEDPTADGGEIKNPRGAKSGSNDMRARRRSVGDPQLLGAANILDENRKAP
jgi:hypothetical protein